MVRSSNIDVQLRLRNARRFQAEVKASAAQLEAMGLKGAAAMGRFAAQADRLKNFGRNMTRRVTLPILGLGAASVKAFADFDGAMNQSLAIMGDVAPELREKMADTAREIARTTTFSATEAAESYFFLASAGLDAQQSLAALPAVAAFAQAGMFDMATATDLLTDAQSALGLRSDDAAKNLENMAQVSDVLVKANILANATVEQFSQSLTNKAGAALKNLGKDVEEGVAVLAAFADQGVKGQVAGTALAIVLRDLQTASIKNKDAWKESGVAIFDAQGEMRNMADIIGDLEGLLDGMSDKQRKVTLAQLGFADKSQSYLLSLLGSSDAIREYEKGLRDAAGITDEVADKQLEALSEQFGLIKDEVIDAGIAFGETLAPAALAAGKGLASVARWISELPKPLKTVTAGALGFLAVIGPLTWSLGVVAGATGKWIVFLPKAIALVNQLRLASIMLWITLAANPIGLVIAAAVALTVGLVVAYKKVEWFRNAVDAVWSWIKGNWPLLAGILAGPFGLAAGKIVQNWGGVKTFFSELPGKIGGFLSGVVGTIITPFSQAFNWVKDKIDWVIDQFEALPGKLESVLDDVTGFLDPFGGGGPNITNGFGLFGNADGTDFWRGGITLVGERGPEIVDLPRGSEVIPNRESRQIADRLTLPTVGGSQTIVVPVSLDGRVIAEVVADNVEAATARA